MDNKLLNLFSSSKNPFTEEQKQMVQQQIAFVKKALSSGMCPEDACLSLLSGFVSSLHTFPTIEILVKTEMTCAMIVTLVKESMEKHEISVEE